MWVYRSAIAQGVNPYNGDLSVDNFELYMPVLQGPFLWNGIVGYEEETTEKF